MRHVLVIKTKQQLGYLANFGMAERCWIPSEASFSYFADLLETWCPWLRPDAEPAETPHFVHANEGLAELDWSSLRGIESCKYNQIYLANLQIWVLVFGSWRWFKHPKIWSEMIWFIWAEMCNHIQKHSNNFKTTCTHMVHSQQQNVLSPWTIQLYQLCGSLYVLCILLSGPLACFLLPSKSFWPSNDLLIWCGSKKW